MMIRIVGTVALFLLLLGVLRGQEETSKEKIIQLSGVVTIEHGDDIVPLPFATVGVRGRPQGTITEFDGFFSIVVVAGEEVEIRSLGYKPEIIQIPDTNVVYYSVVITLEQQALDLPLIDILPIPSREHFKHEFLAMNVSDPMSELARQNLDAGLMEEIRNSLPADGGEASRIYQREVVQNYVYSGQFKPQNIFSPVAWKKFIDAWRRGDFKKKKKKK